MTGLIINAGRDVLAHSVDSTCDSLFWWKLLTQFCINIVHHRQRIIVAKSQLVTLKIHNIQDGMLSSLGRACLAGCLGIRVQSSRPRLTLYGKVSRDQTRSTKF